MNLYPDGNAVNSGLVYAIVFKAAYTKVLFVTTDKAAAIDYMDKNNGLDRLGVVWIEECYLYKTMEVAL